MRWLVALIVLAALFPLPTVAAASWSVDAIVAVKSETTADFTWRISGLNQPLRLKIPDGGSFVEVRDDQGRVVQASATATEVNIAASSRPYTIRFALEGDDEAPFVSFPAQVASAPDSPVSVGITLPAGWSLSGFRDNDDDTPDARGTFHKTGPTYVEFLALRPGFTDAGPDARVSGHAVRREAFANISREGMQWSLVTTYDADVYSRSWDLDVPEGASDIHAYTPLGELATTRTADGIAFQTPYPVGFGLGGRSFTVEMTLPPPDPHGGAFREANLSVRAAEGDTVSLVARLPEGAQYAGARVAGGREAPSTQSSVATPLRYEASGPLSVGVAFLPAPAAGHVQFEEGAFVVDAPRALEGVARATAANASALLPRVSSFAHDGNDARPFFVSYTDENVFGWEEGFYSNGLNTISIRASTLANVTDARAHLVPVGILVHEATHGLIDRRVPDAPHNLSFLHEGLARLAETQTEAYFPDEVLECEKDFLSQHCEVHSARPGAAELQQRYASGASFDIAWGANGVGDDVRGDLYDYSGLVLHAYVERAPPGALENALLHVGATRFAGPDGSDAGRLLDILLANAPGTTAQALLYPSAEAASLRPGEFAFCLGDLVAPAYPWDEGDVKRPRNGCPATGYGARDAALPAPPAAPTTDVTPTPPSASPSPVVAPPPKISPPITGATPDDLTPTPDGGEAPGAIVDATPGARQAPSIEVPAPALLGGMLCIAVAALLARRR
ncbi:MAG TPA: hypothetical protein VM370_13875 [Candidatus Thermoplasmatota archaeon]|nr:hypothetical protein [Candidatus Thermoplasmatota archaeon]